MSKFDTTFKFNRQDLYELLVGKLGHQVSSLIVSTAVNAGPDTAATVLVCAIEYEQRIGNKEATEMFEKVALIMLDNFEA